MAEGKGEIGRDDGGAAPAPRIAGLEALLAARDSKVLPPVEQWDPPYCGDIGLAIAADGTWSYRGSAIRRPALVKLFASVLTRSADGRHFLVTPVEKVDVAVADAAFLAVEMEVDGDGRQRRITFRTNLDDVVTCGPHHALRCADTVRHQMASGAAFKPYVHVRRGLEARLTRALAYDLASYLETEGHAGRHGIWSDGVFFPVS
ncbi:MAG: DUF1285 domain-containing protein [Hyphomicrobiaceae bacterium]|nr:DUF1285 domain-containing protein [Hyphomicrobiaceae bacterium]